MGNFGKFYLDKEKDIVVSLHMEGGVLRYTLSTENYRTDNLIRNLARISNRELSLEEGTAVITGQIPCYIKGDGQRVYILRLNGLKLANIYPDGRVEVNSMISAIAKTLMSQTKDYRYSFRETLVKSYVRQEVKLRTDLHTHGNANLSPDILIALAIKHQIRYPLYYIKKLGLTLTPAQQALLEQRREQVEGQTDLTTLTGKYRQRRVDDNTFINFARLILENPAAASENIRRIRLSLSILKDSQAVFTNLEKLYLYRYVFTKGVPAQDKLSVYSYDGVTDPDIRGYLQRMEADRAIPGYAQNTLYEDTLLWIGREYQKRHICYVEISDTTLVKRDGSAIRMLEQIHRILPLVKAETGVDIRFLAAIRRIPLTLVKDAIAPDSYLTEAVQALKAVCTDPYVVGSDFVGEEISDIGELAGVIREIVTEISSRDPNWTLRVHAGENDTLRGNMAKAISLVEQSLLPGQSFPPMRIGHGLYCESLRSRQGKALLEKIRAHGIVLEFQLTSNVRLNNLIDLRAHPLKTYLSHGIACVMGTDGYGLYGTDSIDEQLALENLLKLTDGEFLQMKAAEDAILARQSRSFAEKTAAFPGLTRCREALDTVQAADMRFHIHKQPTFPVLRSRVRELPWDKYALVIAGGSFGGGRLTQSDKHLLDRLLTGLDPNKVFFLIGHKLRAQEAYLVEHNPGFEIYSIVPSLLERSQLLRLERAKLTGIRISTESQEMGIYKSFNYELFERRNSVLIAFDCNSALTNLVQEARNGKGRTYIFLYPRSALLKAKAESLQGYVTVNAAPETVLRRIQKHQHDIGTRL